jgi:Tfp pilus assembly protein FimT
LLVVIALIAILSALAVPAFSSIQQSGRISQGLSAALSTFWRGQDIGNTLVPYRLNSAQLAQDIFLITCNHRKASCLRYENSNSSPD